MLNTKKCYRSIFLLIMLPALVISGTAWAASVNLRWNSNAEPDLSHYNVYYGTASRAYGNPIPVGKVRSYAVNGLVEGRRYYFAVAAVDTSGNESGYSSEVSANATSSEPAPDNVSNSSDQPNSVSLATSPNSPQNEGTVIRFTASASGGSGTYEYKFWERGPATNYAWTVIRDYSPSNTLQWDSTGKAGDNNITVWVRSAGSDIDAWDPQRGAGRDFIIQDVSNSQPSSVRLATSVASPQNEGTSVRFTATASGGSGSYEYKFWERGPATNYAWTVIRDYSTSNTLQWDSTGKAGDNNIAVWVRSAGTDIDAWDPQRGAGTEFKVGTAAYRQDFEGYADNEDPQGWLDTGANNSLVENDSLFKVVDIGSDKAFGTTSTSTNIHSHLVTSGIDTLSGYEYTGRMMITDAGAGIGVTFFSDYPQRDAYYRLRRHAGNPSFHITAHGTNVSGNIYTYVTPQTDQWYRFRIQVNDTGTQTEILAKVWMDGQSEPVNWQASASDASTSRLTAGTIGLWSMGTGEKYGDNLAADSLN
jgi:hypothetical protein